jgi:hypothetical protein
LLCFCVALLLLQVGPNIARAGTLDIAVYHTSLARPGPGLLLRDILKDEDVQVLAVTQIIAHAAADILLLLDIDYDHDLLAIKALRDKVSAAGVHYPHVFAMLPNTGMPTGLDLDRDRRRGGPRDAQGFGFFSGQGGMALLSKHPIRTNAVQDHSAMLWRDLPGALLSLPDGSPLLTADVSAGQRLSQTGAWVVPVTVADRDIWLMAFHATPPVFDPFADHNARRNHDEAAFWTHLLDGQFAPPATQPFVIAGGSNMDPNDSAGRPAAMRALLSDPRLQDPRPQGGGHHDPTPEHQGDPALDTARWPAPGPGNLRVEYILPSADLLVLDARVIWPDPDDPLLDVAVRASRHFLVSVTLDWP